MLFNIAVEINLFFSIEADFFTVNFPNFTFIILYIDPYVSVCSFNKSVHTTVHKPCIMYCINIYSVLLVFCCDLFMLTVSFVLI